ncbi:hypothetical protein M413DRAFT_399631 [Hebeloma cylindrosporum]|uniref:SWI/SNF and RSC complexes subunit ssr4 n=1 Tax=Hebeloma cylindrosporum TaxID=76867 RepID=A0A0C3C2Y4_HEBCY|nr:hypothetical protein M413DRAFT_399631 [Hebeloma cylindrosporum h7]
MASFAQLQQEGLCLRFPENITPQREVSYEGAVNMLLRGAAMAPNVPFSWSFIDKPSDGTIFLLFLSPNSPFPSDGIRYQEAEAKYNIPAGARELEIQEIKFGFIPNSQDSTASRVRRRYRLHKGGNPQLVLVHYTRGPQTLIQPNLMTQPVRAYPLRTVNEPSVFVAGEKSGQKSYPPGAGPMQMHGSSGPSTMPTAPIGMAMNFSQQQAMLAQQNSNMEALERRRERERAAMAQRSDPAAGRPPPSRTEDDDSGDEIDQISTRTLATARYKRNHDWMNEVFHQAAFGQKTSPTKIRGVYSVFNISDIESKTGTLQAEIEALQAKAAQRRADKIRESQSVQGGDVSMAGIGESIAV